jgi:branched-subunit amino acid transport protein
MNVRRLVTIVIIILLIAIFRPSGFWRELKRIWEQREIITRILTTLILVWRTASINYIVMGGLINGLVCNPTAPAPSQVTGTDRAWLCNPCAWMNRGYS